MLFRKSSCDWMIVGLGNPGTEYTHTRHNVGFRVTDLLAGQLRIKIDRLKMKALTRFVDWKGSRILLVQPQTYMNLSGAAVSALASYYKIPPERILVIFDDISLPVGTFFKQTSVIFRSHHFKKGIVKRTEIGVYLALKVTG